MNGAWLLPLLLPLQDYEQVFDSERALGAFRFTDPSAWRRGVESGNGFLELHRQSRYQPAHRSPLNIAVLSTVEVGSFTLELDAMQIGREYAHRDLCLFFGVQAPDRYYYAHLGTAADASSHHVHIVDGAPRRAITTQRTSGVDWGRDVWRNVRLVRDAASGRIEVFFDGAEEPVLVAEDRTFARGMIGVGSFDDEGRFDNIALRSSDAREASAEIFTPMNLPRVLSEDGGWCWFEDPRAIVHEGRLIVGTVAAGVRDPARKGDIEAIAHDLESGETRIVELQDRLQLDDHDSPAFCELPDGSLFAMWAKHGNENRMYFRRSKPGSPMEWGPLDTFVPSESSRVTYSNLFVLVKEGNRVYDFFRGLDRRNKPSYMFSDDGGESWQRGGIVIDVPGEFLHRPYVRYASNGADEIHLLYTEGHPRVFANSVYHVFYRGGYLHRSDGSRIAPLGEGLEKPELGTLVFRGDPGNVAWTVDIELDSEGRPFAVYSVRTQGGHRFRHARWDGSRWRDHALAFAGTPLYEREADYTGLAALDPDDPSRVFISTNADPVSGEPLISAADGKRHHELFMGSTSDSGKTWAWTAITRDSPFDNLRPIVPRWSRERTALLWLRGTLRTYTDYSLEVVALIDP